MKYFILFVLILSCLLSSCGSATRLPEPTGTPTTPNPTATITLTPTSTPSPTPDPMQLTIDQLGKAGLNVEITTGKLTYKGIEVLGTTFDAIGLHVQIGDQRINIPQTDILKRFAVKEGSVVIYDKPTDLYNDSDMKNWPRVKWAFNPDLKTDYWKGWVSRDKTISPTVYPNLTTENYGDPIIPVMAGNTWDEYHDFVIAERAFLQPFPKDAVLPNPINKQYQGGPDTSTPPFKMDDWSKFGMRNSINFWIVKANHEEKRESDTGGITEQILNPSNRSDIQTLHFASGDTSKVRISYFFQDEARFGAVFPNGYLMPSYYIGGPIWRSAPRFVNIRQYYVKFGYADPAPGDSLGNVNNRIGEMVLKWMDTLVVPEELQKIWLTDQAWFVR